MRSKPNPQKWSMIGELLICRPVYKYCINTVFTLYCSICWDTVGFMVNKDWLIWLFFKDFIIFPERFYSIKMENNIFWSYKNAHFGGITVQTLSTKKGLKWDFCFNAKFVQICAVFLQKWPYFWLLEIFFSIFMGHSLYGKIMKLKKYLYRPFLIFCLQYM